jgi:hypothetical protein
LPKEDWPEWTMDVLEATRLSPSAMNRQPWRFHVEVDSVTIATNEAGHDFNLSKRLDCGIAMLHLEVAALNKGMHGTWELLETPEVARFTIDNM